MAATNGLAKASALSKDMSERNEALKLLLQRTRLLAAALPMHTCNIAQRYTVSGMQAPYKHAHMHAGHAHPQIRTCARTQAPTHPPIHKCARARLRAGMDTSPKGPRLGKATPVGNRTPPDTLDSGSYGSLDSGRHGADLAPFASECGAIAVTHDLSRTLARSPSSARRLRVKRSPSSRRSAAGPVLKPPPFASRIQYVAEGSSPNAPQSPALGQWS